MKNIERHRAIMRKTCYKGRTFLHYAVVAGSVRSIIKFLREHGDLINYQDQDGMTALHFAVRFSPRSNIIRCLVELGNADVNIESNSGRTPLDYAQEKKLLPVVKYLMNHGAESRNVEAHGAEGHHIHSSLDSCKIKKSSLTPSTSCFTFCN